MKLKNKLLSAGLAACMVVPMAMPVCAEDVQPAGPSTLDTTLKYEVTSHYKWEIHSEVDFGKDKGHSTPFSEGNVIKVNENVIPEGTKLSITAKGDGDADGAFTIKSGNVSIPYKVKSDRVEKYFVLPSEEVLSVVAGENTKTANITFTLFNAPPHNEDPAEIAGIYIGHIIYTASIAEA